MMTTQIFLDRSMIIIFFFLLSFSSAQRKTLTVELIHRDSPRSPLYNPLHSASDRLNAAFLRSISRSRHFSTKPYLNSGVSGGGGEYFMSFSIGTPPSNFKAIVDTGSDLTWIQCEPCQKCYEQDSPIFNKTHSSTYKTETCYSNKNCQDLSEIRCDESQHICKYDYHYGDGSFTDGDVATETVTIGSSSGSPESFPGTIFGCGYDNNGTFEKLGSGIIGLGGGPLSLISQLGASKGKKFSYCLSSSTKSVINLGNNSITSKPSNHSAVLTTPLLEKFPQTYYYLTLEAITVGNKKLLYTGGESKKKTGNIIIDSGTTLTLLESKFFSGFGAVVENSVTGATSVSDPETAVNLPHCFKAIGKEKIGLPEITMHFTNTDVKLNTTNAFIERSGDVMCLSMMPREPKFKDAIYGNLVQMDFLVGYDLVKKTVSFQRMDCSENF